MKRLNLLLARNTITLTIELEFIITDHSDRPFYVIGAVSPASFAIIVTYSLE